MIRLKTLPAGWRETIQEGTKDYAGEIKTIRTSKSKGNIKSKSYGSFEAILESTPTGTYRVKYVID